MRISVQLMIESYNEAQELGENMLNYMKSELYRIRTSKGTYIMFVLFSVLVVLFNLMIYGFKIADSTFPYGTTKFSLGTLADSLQMLILICLVIASVVFAGEFKNNTIKNVVSFGISKTQMYIGKYIVTLLFAFILMPVVALMYALSAYLLLDNSGSQYLILFIKALVINLPIFISCITLGMALFFAVQNEVTGYWIWGTIIVIVPMVLALIGMKVDLLADIAKWLPWNLVASGEMTDTGYVYEWGTYSGAVKSIISGVGFSIVFFIIGITTFRKTEIK